MPLDPAALPLLLAGPILRRVEADLVCVWIATSQRCEASLLLFEGTDVVASSTPNDDLRAAWVSSLQTTLQCGARFHVLTVMLDLRSPGGNASRSAGQLKSNHGYSYDLHLHPQSDPTKPLNLRALGLLAGPIPLGYDLGELPSFKTAPEDRDKLVIVHGSCRRMFETPPLADDPALDGPFPPPGGWPTAVPTPSTPIPEGGPVEFPEKDYPTVPKRDGCLWIDALIDPRGPMPNIAARPHQLFLTGDQIYADDVPAVLLPVLNHVGRVLIGNEELPADAAGSAFTPATLSSFPPAFRRDITLRRGGFSTSDGESHLLTFGEFIAYYVLTWSPELWTRDLWPADFDPTKIIMPVEWRNAFLFADDIAQPPVNSAAYKELLEALPESASGVPGEPPAKSLPPQAHAQWYFDQRRIWLTGKYWSPALFEWWTRRFREGLPRVRRALANVPTYMLADDHEITDDWYFSRQWRDAVFSRPLGVDIIRHGLMAYTLMQGWGNDPRRWATGVERELLERMRTWIAATPAVRRTSANRLQELLGLPFTPPPNTVPTFRPLVQYSYRIEGPCHRVLVLDGRTRRRFPARNAQAGGIDYEGPTGLFGDSAMAEALPEPPANDTKVTFVVTGVPVLGPDGMELALLPFQRLARLLLSVDAEAWSYEPASFEALLWALSRYQSVVLLSGDIHVAFSAALDYWSAPTGKKVRTARIVQLVSSGLTQDWGGKTPVLKANALTHDIFEAVTTASVPTERVGWGTPVRTALTPPVALGKMVTVPKGKVAHPSYRLRLKMRAPVVPTHGWPAGSTEERPPEWGWRLAMERDQRPESTSTPNLERRWTPVARPIDPVAPDSLGWHAKAVRRLAFGRVFAFERNVGIVTLERSGEAWSVRHVIAGELPPLAETGVTPAGLQPYVVHRIALVPQPPATWSTTSRPHVHDDGGWGVDATEPALQLLLHWLPLIWRVAAKHVDPLWPDLPGNLDEPARDALITKAADQLAGTFRRRILRELGPFAAMTDAQLDAITEPQIAALSNRIGKFEIAKEARALVRPDLERMMNLDSAATDRAAFFDDVLLIACSDWVNERNWLISLIAGLLATFRAPVTRHVPVLAGLLGGLWDRWRFGTTPEYYTPPALPAALGGLVSLPPRIGAFVREMLNELLVDIIEDHNPRREGGPPVFPPELALAVAGAMLSLKSPKRMTAISGWEDLTIPVGPGARRGDLEPLTLARQTLSVLVHPGNRARFVAPAQRLSLTLMPPADALSPGMLFAGWDAKFQIESEIGGGVIQRVATEAGGWLKQPWAAALPSLGVPGAKLVMSFLRPTKWTPAEGIELRFTPSIAFALGFTNDAAGLRPTFEVRFSLNDTEDRIALKPKNDGFLAQILPTDGITLPLDATVAWDVQRGWRFLGLGDLVSSVAAEKKPTPATPPTAAQKKVIVQTPVNKKLGLLTLNDRSFDLGYDGDGDGVTITATLAGTVSLNVGLMRFSVSGLGAKVTLHIPSDPLDNFDLRDIDVDPATPTGLAVSVSGKVVEGGGFLQRIETPTGAVSWRGGLRLRLNKRVDVGAWAIIETGGGLHWSLLVFLVARFNPPLKLSTGWRLVSVGGMLGLHRTMNTDALRDAALGVSGNLDALFLPDRPEQRFLELMPVADRFFPAAEDHHVGGIMAVFEWGVTAKKTNARFRAALLLEIGNDQLALYGTAQFGFPTVDADQVVRIRAGFEALYDVERKFVHVSLTLTEATLFRRVHLTGGAALLIRWGDDDEFAFTLGGFHPAFRPYIPEGMREPPRLGAHWKPKSLLDLDIQAYFAFTSTSLQFGASAYLEAGASWGGVRGDIAFNMIVMSEPKWYFETDLSFRVTAYLFGCDLISAGFRGSISGPGPWHLEATVYWEVCGVDISKDLGPYEWGDKESVSSQSQEARQILGDGLEDVGAWSVRRAGRLRVQLREGNEGAIDPRDQIEVRQSRLPLGTDIQVHDRNPLSDGGTWTLTSTTTGLLKSGDLTDVFPMRRYREKPPKETPFKQGLVSGARFGGAGWDVRKDLVVGSEEDATEDLVLDSLPVPPRRTRVPIRVLLDDALRSSAPTRSVDRNWTRHAILLEARR